MCSVFREIFHHPVFFQEKSQCSESTWALSQQWKKSQLLLDASFVSRPCIEEATSVSTFNSFNLDISFFQCVKHGFISPDTNRGIRLVNFDMANLLFNLLAHWQNPSIQQKSVHESWHPKGRNDLPGIPSSLPYPRCLDESQWQHQYHGQSLEVWRAKVRKQTVSGDKTDPSWETNWRAYWKNAEQIGDGTDLQVVNVSGSGPEEYLCWKVKLNHHYCRVSTYFNFLLLKQRGLQILGLKPRDKLVMYCDTKAEWMVTAMGCFKYNYTLGTTTIQL